MSYLLKYPLSCRWAITAPFCLIILLAVSFENVLAGEYENHPSDDRSSWEAPSDEGGDSLETNEESLPAFASDKIEADVADIQPLDLSMPYNSFEEESNWVDRLWGRPFRDRLYLGMWTLHVDSGKDQEDENQLIGGAWNGYFGGTFINTHGDRVWSAGWQRTLFQQRYGEVEVEAGYRAGMMYGYTKYLQMFDTRFFPLFQTLLDIEYKQFGVELSWAGVVFTAGLYYRF